jgi:hypothetical protein
MTIDRQTDWSFKYYAVRALYAYEARGADELGLDEGELVELSSGPEGGQHYGDGWWEGTHHYRSEAAN